MTIVRSYAETPLAGYVTLPLKRFGGLCNSQNKPLCGRLLLCIYYSSIDTKIIIRPLIIEIVIFSYPFKKLLNSHETE